MHWTSSPLVTTISLTLKLASLSAFIKGLKMYRPDKVVLPLYDKYSYLNLTSILSLVLAFERNPSVSNSTLLK